MIIAFALRALLMIGVSEARAIGVVQSKWLPKVAIAVVTAVSLLFGCWYLTHLGGVWREAAIREEWAGKFAEVDKLSSTLEMERQQRSDMIAQGVKDALASMPVVLPPLPSEPAPVVLPGCPVPFTLPANAAKKYNQIGK